MSWLPSTVVGVADPQTAVNTADIATIEGEQTTQDGLITANTAKTGITSGQASEITANTAKISYTDSAQVSTNTSDISTLQAEQTTQDSAIALNTAKVSYDDTEAAAATAAITTLQSEQSTQDTAIAANTAKTGITSGQTSEITANTAKVTNATHTGDVTGSTALTLDSSAVTGQTLVTADALDHVLIADASDTGALKKALVSDLGADNFVAQASAPTGDTALLWLDTDEALPAVAPVAPVVESGTTFTLSSTHSGKVVECMNAGATTITVPTDAADDLPDGYWALLVCEGAGGITVSHAGTWRGSSPTTTAAQNGKLLVIKTATANTWIVLS